MTREYSIEAVDLLIKDVETSATVWRGRFEDTAVYKIIPLPSDAGCLVLLDPGGSKRASFENLFLVDPVGKVRWKAELPQGGQAFTDVFLAPNGVEASTWYGIRVSADLDSGCTKKIGFGK